MTDLYVEGVWRTANGAEFRVDERLAVLQRFAAIVTAQIETLADAIGRETGKPLWEARTEVATMAAKVTHSAKAYQERTGERRSAVAARATADAVAGRSSGFLAIMLMTKLRTGSAMVAGSGGGASLICAIATPPSTL